MLGAIVKADNILHLRARLAAVDPSMDVKGEVRIKYAEHPAPILDRIYLQCFLAVL